jgi:hypothetical protein
MSSGKSESQFDEEGVSNCQRQRSHQPDGQGQADRGTLREKMQMDTEKGENSTGEEGKEAGPDDSPRFSVTTWMAPYLWGVIEAFVNPVAHNSQSVSDDDTPPANNVTPKRVQLVSIFRSPLLNSVPRQVCKIGLMLWNSPKRLWDDSKMSAVVIYPSFDRVTWG